jgi:hypothetical protein
VITMTKTVLQRLMDDMDKDAVAAELLALERGNPRIKRQVENGLREKRHDIITTLQKGGVSRDNAEELIDHAEEVFLDEYGHYGIPEPLLRAEAIDVFAKYMIERLNEDEE